jgi:hypothetical protein
MHSIQEHSRISRHRRVARHLDWVWNMCSLSAHGHRPSRRLPCKGLLVLAVLWTIIVQRAALLAQAGSSTITGIVSDSSGSVLPGATVKIANEATGIGLDTVSNERGLYRVPALVPGRYRLEISLDGFDTFRQSSIVLEVSQTLTIDVKLNVPGDVGNGERAR